MALSECLGCTTRFFVGAPRCPHCGGTDAVEVGMPKITKNNGSSYKDHEAPEVTAEEAPAPAPEPEEAKTKSGSGAAKKSTKSAGGAKK